MIHLNRTGTGEDDVLLLKADEIQAVFPAHDDNDTTAVQMVDGTMWTDSESVEVVELLIAKDKPDA